MAAVGLILGSTPSLGKYILRCVITISLYIIELRNRFLKNELEAEATQIERKWHYPVNKEEGYELEPTTIFGFVINCVDTTQVDKPKCKYKFGEHLNFKITHSIGLDLLYIFIFLYALINVFFHLLLLGL